MRISGSGIFFVLPYRDCKYELLFDDNKVRLFLQSGGTLDDETLTNTEVIEVSASELL